jgi:hypothetical protein
MTPVAPPTLLSVEELDAIRACGRTERGLGYGFCLIGVLCVGLGRFNPAAPSWMIAAGLVIVAAGWSTLAWSVFKRARLARSLSSKAKG